MTSINSRCIICGQFFDSKKQLRNHKDKDHRITNSKIVISANVEKTNQLGRQYRQFWIRRRRLFSICLIPIQDAFNYRCGFNSFTHILSCSYPHTTIWLMRITEWFIFTHLAEAYQMRVNGDIPTDFDDLSNWDLTEKPQSTLYYYPRSSNFSCIKPFTWTLH
jgi:hypothetical protein